MNLLMIESDRPELILCGCQGATIQLLSGRPEVTLCGCQVVKI